MYKRQQAMVGVLLATSMVLGACTGAPPQTGAPDTSPSSGSPASPPTAEEVSLRLLTTTAEPGYTAQLEMVERFEDAHPNITISVEAVPIQEFYRGVSVSLASGNPVDIFFPDPSFVKSYVANDALLPLNPAFTDAQLADYKPELLESVTDDDGNVYLAMIVDSGSLLFYNKTLFDDAGITPPDSAAEGWTWPEAVEAMKEVMQVDQAGQVQIWGSTFRQNPPNQFDGIPFPRQMGEPGSPTHTGISDDGLTVTGYIDTPEAIEGFEFFQSLFTDSIIPTQTIPDCFETGQCATKISPPDQAAVMSNYPEIEWGVTPLPYLRTPVMHTGSQGFAVSARSQHPEAALEFVRFVVSDEQSLIYLEDTFRAPARTSLAGRYDAFDGPVLTLLFESLAISGYPRPVTAGFSEYNTITATMFSDIVNGANVEERVRQAAAEIDAALARYED